jgi:hypothetical protein
MLVGRAIAQAVSCWFSTAAARVRFRVWSSGIYGGQIGAGAGFLRVLRFPMPIFIPPNAPQSPSLIIWGWYNRPKVAAVQGTWSHPTSIKKIMLVGSDEPDSCSTSSKFASLAKQRVSFLRLSVASLNQINTDKELLNWPRQPPLK